MLFKRIMSICLAVLIIILIFGVMNVLLGLKMDIVIYSIFGIFIAFVLGLGFCRYCVNDNQCIRRDTDEN